MHRNDFARRMAVLTLTFLMTAPAIAAGPIVNATANGGGGLSGLAVKIDQAAYASPPERLPQQEAAFAGDIVAWMIARTPLRPEEEAAQADAAHAELLAKSKRLATPDEAQAVFQKLLDTLPDFQKPTAFSYSLTVIDAPELNVFNVGGGHVYITQSLLQMLLVDKTRGREMLAFAVAHELGHNALLHTRRGFQAQLLQDESRRGIQTGVDSARMQKALLTTVSPAGHLARFLYTKQQEYEADLFAIHLCRNAGFKMNPSLDFLRLMCWQGRPQVITQAGFQTAANAYPPGLASYLGAHPDPYQRLKRLLLELTGHYEDETPFGLFEFNRNSGGFIRAENVSLPATQRAVVFIHGMEGDKTAYIDLMKLIAAEPSAAAVRLFALNYPNDQSLACTGRFLKNELARVCVSCKQVDFVCHSAGGLVFRFYTEVLQGEFRQAIFQGTPHGGSELAALRYLIETGEFFGGLKLGFPVALQQTLIDGRGQISNDLHPDSLFLQYLNRFDKPHVNRYTIYRGRSLKLTQSLAVTATVNATRELLKRNVEQKTGSNLLHRAIVDATERVTVPREVSDGDYCVTVDSAALRGVPTIRTTSLNHLSLKTDPAVMREVARLVLAE